MFKFCVIIAYLALPTQRFEFESCKQYFSTCVVAHKSSPLLSTVVVFIQPLRTGFVHLFHCERKDQDKEDSNLNLQVGKNKQSSFSQQHKNWPKQAQNFSKCYLALKNVQRLFKGCQISSNQATLLPRYNLVTILNVFLDNLISNAGYNRARRG